MVQCAFIHFMLLIARFNRRIQNQNATGKRGTNFDQGDDEGIIFVRGFKLCGYQITPVPDFAVLCYFPMIK